MAMKRSNNRAINSKSFTLMEAIVAIFVITTGIVGVLGLVTQTIASSTFSKDKLIAAYLAQEGIEIVRNIRDTNWLNNLTWDTNLDLGDFQADYSSSNLTSCSAPCDYGSPGTNLQFLKIDGGFYKYSPLGTETKFKRKITISKADVADTPPYYRKNIKVEVFWQEKEKIYSVPAQENLYNWYK